MIEEIKKIAAILAEHFKDPIDIPCPYCKAAEALYKAGCRLPDTLKLSREANRGYGIPKSQGDGESEELDDEEEAERTKIAKSNAIGMGLIPPDQPQVDGGLELTDEEIIRLTIHPQLDASGYSVPKHDRVVSQATVRKCQPIIEARKDEEWREKRQRSDSIWQKQVEDAEARVAREVHKELVDLIRGASNPYLLEKRLGEFISSLLSRYVKEEG